MQDKVAILEQELADYKKKKEETELAEETRGSSVSETEVNELKMAVEESKMQLNTIEAQKRELQV